MPLEPLRFVVRHSRCQSCGQKILKRESRLFEECGLCSVCAEREVGPLKDLLSDALNDPGRLVIAEEKGWNSWEDEIFQLAVRLYVDGWRCANEQFRKCPEASTDEELR